MSTMKYHSATLEACQKNKVFAAMHGISPEQAMQELSRRYKRAEEKFRRIYVPPKNNPACN